MPRNSAAGVDVRQATLYLDGRSTYKLTWEEIVALYRLAPAATSYSNPDQ
jgi:hypothetical protein